MKKLLLLVFLFALSARVGAQYVSIPDSNFRKILKNFYGLSDCFNGAMLDTTCTDLTTVQSMDLTQSGLPTITTCNIDGIQYLSNMQSLYFRNVCISNIPAFPRSLKVLSGGQNALHSIPQLPDSLVFFDLHQNFLTDLPNIPSTLRILNCRQNKLTSLPSLPNELRELNCRYNRLDSISSFPDSLRILNVGGNKLLTLPSLPPLISIFDCFSNKLTTLPLLPDSLVSLDCSRNQLALLPVLPQRLFLLWCSTNQLQQLPAILPDSLNNLDCNGNLLTVLPPLPQNLETLVCSYNSINQLPVLPAGLSGLYCESNSLSSLPPLPPGLGSLNCRNNALYSLPQLPATLNSLRCSNCSLTSLPNLPADMYGLYIDNNPGITCMPPFNTIEDFMFGNTGITCLPPHAWVAYNEVIIYPFPLCKLFNESNCIYNYNLYGKVYEDKNMNCIADSNETGLRNCKIKLYKNNALVAQTFSDVYGNYGLWADTGSYTYSIDTVATPITLACPAAGNYTVFFSLNDSVPVQNNFGVQCKAADVGILSIFDGEGIWRPGNFKTLKIKAGDMSAWLGLHCLAGVSGLLKVVISGPAHYVSSAVGALIPAVNQDTLIYSMANLGAVKLDSAFRIIVQTDTSAASGNTICIHATITTSAQDINVFNNNLQQCYEVRNSFDPNDKSVFPAAEIDSSQKKLIYTIRFQNTGNLEAQLIFIVDTLDSNLEVGSFELLDYSHQPSVVIKGNVLRFNFPNINLPDSLSNEAHSHGYIQYSMKPKNNLAPGTKMNNTAHIYFDFNAGVKTNTVCNWIKLPKRISTGIFPSPRVPVKLVKN